MSKCRPHLLASLLHSVCKPATSFSYLSFPLFAPPPSLSLPSCQLRLMSYSKPSKGVSGSVQDIDKILSSGPSGGWERCWEEGVTPWDLGRPTPILEHLIPTNSIPNGRALVPGCGSGYDVVALASPKRYAIGLDISEVAIRKARQLAASSQNANYCSFLMEVLHLGAKFFCAIEPNLRPAWASRMRDLLKPDGELITLIFPIDDHEGGPPYKVSVSDYEEVLHPVGFQATSIVDNELAVAARKGREKLGRWRKVKGASAL